MMEHIVQYTVTSGKPYSSITKIWAYLKVKFLLICTLSSAQISGGVGGGGGINKWNQAFRQFSLQITSTTTTTTTNTTNTSTTNLMIKILKSANSIIAVLSFPKSYVYDFGKGMCVSFM
jgi:hypothetical protein